MRQAKAQAAVRRDRLREFDREWAGREDYLMLLRRICYGIFLFCICISMMFPIQEIRDMKILPGVQLALSAQAMVLYMRPYMVFAREGKTVSVYELLRWLPVERADIGRVRFGYLGKLLWKMAFAFIALQSAGALLEGCFSLWNIVYALVFTGAQALLGGGLIVLSGSGKEWREGKKK